MQSELPDIHRPASIAPTEPELERQIPGGILNCEILSTEIRSSKTLNSAAHITPHDPYAALRLPGYRWYVIGTTLSFIGQQMQSTAVGWEIALRSGSHAALALSIVGLVGAAPVILLALPAGHLADTSDRKNLTIVTVALTAVCSIALAFLSLLHGPLTLIYLTLLLGATFGAIGGPARSSLLMQIVPIEIYSNAATWGSSFFQIAAMTGPALAGGIIAIETVHLSGHLFRTLPIAYLLDAAFGFAFALLLLVTPTRPAQRRSESPSLQTLLAGIRFVRINSIILATITLDLFAVLLGGATFLLPIYATTILHVGAVGFGWMRAAPALGALAMALLLAHLPPMKKAGRNLLLAVTGFGLATIVFGFSRSFTLSLVMLFLTGAFDNISVVVRHTLVQVLTPDSMRGRVSAVNNVFIGASNELGGFESGLTAQWFGPIFSVVAGGIGTLLVVIAVAIIWPQVKNFGSLAAAKPIEQE